MLRFKQYDHPGGFLKMWKWVLSSSCIRTDFFKKRSGPHGSCAGARGTREREGRIRRSCDAGVGGFIMVTLGCWFHCRYNYAKLRIQERLAREGIKNKILYESTHLDPARKQTNGGSNSNWAVLSIENPDTIHFIVNKAEMNYRNILCTIRQISIK